MDGGVKDMLIDHKSASFGDCVAWARLKFESYFVNRIKQLIHNFPPYATTSKGGFSNYCCMGKSFHPKLGLMRHNCWLNSSLHIIRSAILVTTEALSSRCAVQLVRPHAHAGGAFDTFFYCQFHHMMQFIVAAANLRAKVFGITPPIQSR